MPADPDAAPEAVEMKPCPFCGGTARKRAALSGYQTWTGHYWIECTGCHAQFPERSEADWGAMAEVWNRRATPTADAAEVERYREALERIVQWADAYPLAVFPEPDFKRAAEVLAAAGMTLDAISASNMRHCVEGVGKIARSALGGAS